MSNIGDLVAIGFVLNDEGDLVLSSDTHLADSILVLGNCFIGDALDTTGDIACGGDIIHDIRSLNYLTGTLFDVDTVGRILYFHAPYDGYISSVYGVLWAATGAGTVNIRTGVRRVVGQTIEDANLDISFTDAAEGGTDSSDATNKVTTFFSRNDCIYAYVQASNIANNNVAVGIVVELTKTME